MEDSDDSGCGRMWLFSQVPQEIALVTWLIYGSPWIQNEFVCSHMIHHLRHVARKIGEAQDPPVPFDLPESADDEAAPESSDANDGPHHKKAPCL